MHGQFVRGAHRPRLPRTAARVLGLAGLGAGLWLLGQGTASAEVTPPPAAPTVVSAPAQALLDTADPLLALTTEAVAPVVASVEVASAPVVEVVEHVVPPVATAVVTPVVSAVDDVLAPVVDPVLPRADELLAPLSPVPDPLSPVGPAAGADVAVQPVVQPASDAPGAAATPSAVPTSSTGEVVSASVADNGRTGDELPVTPAAPVPHPALPAGSPAVAGGSSPSSNDQPSADLAAAVLAAGAAALAAIADDACDAAGNVAFDPSFSPD